MGKMRTQDCLYPILIVETAHQAYYFRKPAILMKWGRGTGVTKTSLARCLENLDNFPEPWRPYGTLFLSLLGRPYTLLCKKVCEQTTYLHVVSYGDEKFKKYLKILATIRALLYGDRYIG